MVLFGFAVTLGLILASSLWPGRNTLSVPSGPGLGFILRYYLFSLTFFVIFTVSAAVRMGRIRAGRPGRWLALSLLSFTIGSLAGSSAFLLLVGLAFSQPARWF